MKQRDGINNYQQNMTTKETRRDYLCFTINKYEQKCCERALSNILEDSVCVFARTSVRSPNIPIPCLYSRLTRDVLLLPAIDGWFRESILL